MSCYKPLLGLRDGFTEKGKPKYRLCSMTDDALDDFSPQEVIQIPCGKCLGCRLQYSKDWSDRLLMESKSHDSNYFFTLTYDDNAVPCHVFEEDESICVLESLRKTDLQKFIKRLRKNYPDDKIRYYICGEYGPQTKRPHYHGILFGLHLDDVEVTNHLSVNKEPVLFSQRFQDIWSNGFAELGTVTQASCSYVSRYVMKKAFSDVNNDCDKFGIEREFNIMSRKPGIGRLYFDEHPGMFDNVDAYIGTEKGSVKLLPSRYFKNLIDDDLKKARRQAAGRIERREKLRQTGLGYTGLLEVEEKAKEDQIAILKSRELKVR